MPKAKFRGLAHYNLQGFYLHKMDFLLFNTFWRIRNKPAFQSLNILLVISRMRQQNEKKLFLDRNGLDSCVAGIQGQQRFLFLEKNIRKYKKMFKII